MRTLKSNNDIDAIPVLPEDVPVEMPELPPRMTIETVQQFKAFGDPTRRRILGIIQNQPATAKQIAVWLGATPGAIGHHLHVLEAAGLAKVVARRMTRGIVANYYTRTARIFDFNLSRDMAGESPGLDIFTNVRNELIESMESGEEDPLLYDGFPRIRLSPERAAYYQERLEALVDDILHEKPDPDGKVYSIFVAMFIAPPYLQGSAISTSTTLESTSSDENE
ncbi:MAG TPA: metalloregulator ArsR/SmtB family transcription factor [Ktedonobacteraceae bacterium]|jgi:DNA-binding transcriptional ArsR family regulator|nr:metalloregulator ArsR/SmtB family transcription factor [Ktedonobacteraceae bacterium]